jgi:adenylate cyclase
MCVAHVLEGSVRKSGSRVRITAQLIDGKTGDHVWAERYDRDLADIFALQDEISEAIVKALKVKLLTQEKKALARRGTHDPEAYEYFLMARQMWTGGRGGLSRFGGIIRLCQKAIDLDPNYAEAWALLARTQENVILYSGQGEGGMAAATRAVALGPNLAEAHAAMSAVLRRTNRMDESLEEAELAYRLDPESYETIQTLAVALYAERRHKDAIPLFQKAMQLAESDYTHPGLLASCFAEIGDMASSRRASEVAISRAEKLLADEPENGAAMGYVALSLGQIGEGDRANAWIRRGLVLDPKNFFMRASFVCAFALLKQIDHALDQLEPLLAGADTKWLNWAKTDIDLDPLRDHSRFVAMIAAAEARFAQQPKEAQS